ncbi:sex pheromone biosynthesis protein CamS [Brevibacillus sp. LEMMJ03]|jgi:protein involved in sex pheromone biosynthesis|nr:MULTISPECIES: CamS family sex pheromone protein [Brevibacillus]TRY24065.1 sex pheromone biosynthesis protein CamS [Brevibacillus sp. LEMMJ03]UYZ13138.1 CamS family sex pheromone protein [Brevibacillus sp. WF146]
MRMEKQSKFYTLALTAVLSVVTAGCSLWPGGNQENTLPANPTLSPVVEVSEDYYGSIQPYKPNQTRGMLAETRYRIDFSHLELGMLEIARDTFPTDEYLFQEGQQIKPDQVREWIAQNMTKAPNGQKKTGMLVHVLEHDYLERQKQQLSGMVLGISLSPVYLDATGQEKTYTTDELRAKGQQLAARIVQAVRVDTPHVPIVIALYQVPDKNSSLVPGRFIMSGTVNANESAVSKWQKIDEEFYLFPSDDAEKAYPQQALQYDKLMRQTQASFSEYIGMTGLGRFMGGKLTELTITATAEFDSRTEVLQFTQFAAAGIDQLIDKGVHVNLYVQTINQPLAIYIRPTSGEPYMHIYRK